MRNFLLFYILLPLVFSQEVIEEDQQCRVRIVDCEKKQVQPKTQLISGKKGLRGTKGEPGQKGETGLPGLDCNCTYVKQLEDKLQSVSEKFKKVYHRINNFEVLVEELQYKNNVLASCHLDEKRNAFFTPSTPVLNSTVVQYQCNKGFSTTDAGQRTCINNKLQPSFDEVPFKCYKNCRIKESVKWVTSNQTNEESSIKHGEEIRFTCKHQTDVHYDVTCENGTFNTDEVVCYPQSCQEIKSDDESSQSKTYVIKPENIEMNVYCDLDTNKEGWIVIQRRNEKILNFNQNWENSKTGFGDLNGEFWLGLEKIHQLTKNKDMVLRVDMIDTNDNEFYVQYHTNIRLSNASQNRPSKTLKNTCKQLLKIRSFYVGDESLNYILLVNGHSGQIGDIFNQRVNGPANGQYFSTPDRDNDRWSDNCARRHTSAWWHNHCFNTNLNDMTYFRVYDGKYTQLKSSVMKIRRAN